MIAIVALGAWSIVVLWGITEGFFVTMIDSQIELDIGDLQIHKSGYLDDPTLENSISKSELTTIESSFERNQVQHSSPRLILEGLLKSSYGATGVQIRGFDPTRESEVTTLHKSVLEGTYLDGPGQILIGKALADNLDVRLNERIVIEAQGVDGPSSKAFRAVGFFSSGQSLLDNNMALITLEDAEGLAEISGVTEIALKLSAGASSNRAKETLREKLGERYSISGLFDLNPLLEDIIRVNYIELVPIMLILSLLAGFGVANTVMFTVIERTREFGVMMAVGLKPKQLSRLVLLESVVASGIGFIIGAALGYGLIWYLATFGIDLSMYTDIFPEFGMPHVVYAVTSGWYWIYALTVVVLTALVAAWYPARRVTRLDPTEAIRHV
jgi:ABC-type lipoprotein release transport system permease subunit